jgi:hypothetical protein
MDEVLRREAYKSLWVGVNPLNAQTMFLDMLAFAESEPDPVVRCGRMDMLVYVYRSANEKAEP